MTATFTLTGRVLDKAKRPVRAQALQLQANVAMLSDATTDEVYTRTPGVMTDVDGRLCEVVNGVRSATPGVQLVAGVQYRIASVAPGILPELVFSSAQATNGVLDLAEIVPEPADLPPTFPELLAGLNERLDAIEEANVSPDPDRPGFFVIGGNALTPDPDHPGYFQIGA